MKRLFNRNKKQTPAPAVVAKHTQQHGKAQVVIFDMYLRSVKGYQVFGPGGDLLAASNEVRTLIQIQLDLLKVLDKTTGEKAKAAIRDAMAYAEYLQVMTED